MALGDMGLGGMRGDLAGLRISLAWKHYILFLLCGYCLGTHYYYYYGLKLFTSRDYFQRDPLRFEF